MWIILLFEHWICFTWKHGFNNYPMSVSPRIALKTIVAEDSKRFQIKNNVGFTGFEPQNAKPWPKVKSLWTKRWTKSNPCTKQARRNRHLGGKRIEDSLVNSCCNKFDHATINYNPLLFVGNINWVCWFTRTCIKTGTEDIQSFRCHQTNAVIRLKASGRFVTHPSNIEQVLMNLPTIMHYDIVWLYTLIPSPTYRHE